MGKRILIVDGNHLSAENLRTRLGAFADIALVQSTPELSGLANEKWDLVVCDWGLAGLDGPSLVRQLRPRERPLFLYTDRSDIVEGGDWQPLGVQKAFTRLQRADLVFAAEAALGESPIPAGLPPAFLLVEDSLTVRTFVKQALRDGFEGCEVIEADDGRTALAAMKQSRVNLVVTDLQMPGMDGMSFVNLLRNNAILKKKPVLVLSGAVTEAARKELSALDKVRILQKPAPPAALVAAARELLA